MARTRGRSRRGTRLIAKVPYGHWKTTTFVAALRVDGLTAPTVVDGAMNGVTFLAYVRQQLAQGWRPGDSGQPIRTQSGRVREAIEAAGAKVVYLPPTARTLTQSSWCSRSSNGCCEAAKRGASMLCIRC